MSRSLRVRLSFMMFLQYFAPGAILPILSHYVQHYLHFTPFQAGVILAAPAVAAFLAPPIVVRLADRRIASERFLAACHAFAAISMLCLAHQTSFAPFLAVFLLYSLAFVPTMALSNTVAFHHARDPRRDFGAVRLWGTVGWATAGGLFGYAWLRWGGVGPAETRMPHALAVSAAVSCLMAVHAMTLPAKKTAPPNNDASGPPEALWRRPGVFPVLCLAFIGSYLNEYYAYGISPFLIQQGFPPETIMPAISLGQIAEIGAMALLGGLLARFGVKRLLAAGIALQAARFLLFAWSENKAILLLGISLHGLFYTFFTTTAYIVMDQRCASHEKTGAQQLINIAVFGFGRLLGSLSAGATAELHFDPLARVVHYAGFWLVPAAIGCCTTLAVLVMFRSPPATQQAAGAQE